MSDSETPALNKESHLKAVLQSKKNCPLATDTAPGWGPSQSMTVVVRTAVGPAAGKSCTETSREPDTSQGHNEFDIDPPAAAGASQLLPQLEQYCRECASMRGVTEAGAMQQQQEAAVDMCTECAWERALSRALAGVPSKRQKVSVASNSSSYMKQCGCCGRQKGTAGFQSMPLSFDGLAPICLGCDAAPRRRPGAHTSAQAHPSPVASHRSHFATSSVNGAAQISQRHSSSTSEEMGGEHAIMSMVIIAAIPRLLSSTGPGGQVLRNMTGVQRMGAGLLLAELAFMLWPQTRKHHLT